MSVADILKIYREQLRLIYNTAETRNITNMVMEAVLELNTLQLEMSRYQLLTTHQQTLLHNYLQRLMQHEPVQYVLGKADFMGMQLNVNSATLIPRPETEELVHWAAQCCGKQFKGTILDIGTGSGCIAIGLKKLLPTASVFACDISNAALEIATQNAHIQHTEITFFQLDILSSSTPPLNFNVIISNPPYIPENEQHQMAKNVVNFEPHSALFTPNAQALIFYEQIIAKCAAGMLQKNGKLFFETHYQHAEAVKLLMENTGFESTEIKTDFFGKNRMVSGQWNSTFRH